MGSHRALRAHSYFTGGIFPITLQLWGSERGGTSAFHRANCRSCSQRREVRSRRRVAEQQRGCYRTCRRSCVRRGSCTTVTAPSVGVCRNPAFAHFRQTNPAVSARFRFPFLLPEEGRGGRRGVELTSSPRQPGALRSALIAYGGPYGVGASLHLQHPQTTAAVGRMQAELRVLRCAARAGRGKQKAAVLRCSPPTRNHGAAEGEGREGCSTAFSPVPPSKGQKPFPKAHTHEWWFTTAAHGAAEPEEKPNAAPWDLYLGCIVCILMGASLVPSA